MRTIRRRGMKLKKEIVFQTRRGKKKARYQWMELWGTNSLWGLIKTQEESEVSERKARWEETSEEANQPLIIKKFSNLNSEERGWCDEKATREFQKREKISFPTQSLSTVDTSKPSQKQKQYKFLSIFQNQINYFYLL